jgi:hypothetical protein
MPVQYERIARAAGNAHVLNRDLGRLFGFIGFLLKYLRLFKILSISVAVLKELKRANDMAWFDKS